MSGIALERGIDDGGSVDAGQAQVGDDDVEREVGEPRERGFARFRLFDGIAVIGELLGDGLAERRFVLDEQEMFHRIRHLAGAKSLTQVADFTVRCTHYTAASSACTPIQPSWRQEPWNEKRFRS